MGVDYLRHGLFRERRTRRQLSCDNDTDGEKEALAAAHGPGFGGFVRGQIQVEILLNEISARSGEALRENRSILKRGLHEES